ncbi:hypothetical protein ZEAMMB73_Zm00001d052497 [Zea mays]|uniref:Uncharacterized protein n=1 Tax=Zea mays TaxID=4577 RepID=A0A1D6QHK4_MAIZE|nr:hypothetical protein ZEAMMB73_Zm00001d052497 [Zea mays]
MAEIAPRSVLHDGKVRSVGACCIRVFVFCKNRVTVGPISFYQVEDLPQLFLRSSIVFISCALFGVTCWYAVRRDLDNIQLETGPPATFAFVRVLALLESGRTLVLSIDTLISVISVTLDAAVSVVDNILIFLPAAVALDYCFKMRFLSPFPRRKQ